MSITTLLNIKYPIFQGAMAQISHYQAGCRCFIKGWAWGLLLQVV